MFADFTHISEGFHESFREDPTFNESESVKNVQEILLPSRVITGKDAIDYVPEILKKLKLDKTVYIITGNKTYDIAGKRVCENLEKNNISCGVYRANEASMEEIEKILKKIDTEKPCCLLGIGSGKSIDLAKLASTKAEIPFLSIPTAASHDGIISARASIHSEKESKSIQAQSPIAVVADTEIIANAPYELLAAGCGDVISNYTSVLDWELASRLHNEPFSTVAASMSLMSAELIRKSAGFIRPGLESSARLVIQALVTSGIAMSFAGTSRPASGAEHMFSHVLDKILEKPAHHGFQCALGSIVMLYLHGRDWTKYRDTMTQIGIPTTAKEIGIDDDKIIEALIKAPHIRPERYTILGKGLTESAAIKAAKVTGIIE